MTSEIKTDVKDFWEKKIIGWETGRYENSGSSNGFLERLADRASDSLRFRLEHTAALLAPRAEGKRILELGCGSGLLAPRFMEAGARSYTGVDIAPSAIARAGALAVEQNLGPAVTFIEGGLDKTPAEDFDIVFSLGLLDWLTDEEISDMFARTKGADFLHAISEKRASPAQWLHRLYCWISYGHRTGGYIPRYVRPRDMAAVAARHGAQDMRVIRHPRLSFGAIITSMPLPDAEPV